MTPAEGVGARHNDLTKVVEIDIVIRQCRLFDLEDVLDVGIQDGSIACVAPNIRQVGRMEIEAQGCIVSPGLMDPHVHIDKCFTLHRFVCAKKPNTLDTWIASQREIKRGFTEADVKGRAVRALRMAVSHGTTATRTYVEADPIVEYRAVAGVLAASGAVKS